MRLSNLNWRPVVVVSVGIVLASCSQANLVPDAEGAEPISSIGMSCGKPYKLTQDCSIWDGARRKIRVKELDMKVAATEDGSIVVVTGTKRLSSSYEAMTNTAYEVVKRELYENDISITEVRPIATAGELYGYLIIADGDAYSILKEYSVE